MIKCKLVLIIAFSFLTAACGSSGSDVDFPTSRIKTEVIESDIISKSKDITLVTFVEERKLKRARQKIRIPDQEEKVTSIVAVQSNEEIQLIDFFVSGVNEEPKLSFESTARSLVFLNPLFANISFEKRAEIFTYISDHEKFKDLVGYVSNMESILDDDVVDLSTDIAIDVAEEHLQSDIDIAQTQNEEQSAPERQNSQQSSNNIFSSTSFPLNSCGDSLPTDKNSYPVNMYPVYIDVSVENLQGAQNKFCRDAYEKLREDGQKSIQVSSFLSIEKASAFRDIMFQNFGSGEVGEPTVIEEPRSHTWKELDSVYSFFTNFFAIPNANAQSSLDDIREFSVSQNFEDRAKVSPAISPLALGHWVDVKANEKGIAVSGTSFAAQQIIVVPASKLPKQIHIDDYTGEQKEEDIVAEYFIEPAEFGIWDLTALQTMNNNLSDSPNFDEVLVPKDGSKVWKPGEYVLLMSGGRFLNRRTPERLYGAFHLNAAIYLTDLFSIATSPDLFGKNTILELSAAIAKAGASCATKEDALDQINCLAGQDNVVAVFQALGGESEELLTELFRFQGEAGKKLAKKLAGTINVIDKGINISRMAFLGVDYLGQMNDDGLYTAKFTVTAPPPDPTLLALSEITDINNFNKVNINCKVSPVGQYEDLEFKNCAERAMSAEQIVTFENYSSNWYEISLTQQVNGKDYLNSFLITPGDDGAFRVVDGSGAMMSTIMNFDLSMRQMDNVKFVDSKVLQIKKHANSPSTSVKVECGRKPFSIWNIEVTPKCTSQGTYLDLEGEVQRTTYIEVGDDILVFEPSLTGNSGSITSSGLSARFRLYIP